MKLSEAFAEGGIGVIATANKEGVVNLAIYAVPEVVGDDTLVFGMTEGVTFENLSENPHAAYMYISPEGQFKGLRLTLELLEVKSSGALLEKKRKLLAGIIGSEEAKKLKYLAFFKVVKIRPLV